MQLAFRHKPKHQTHEAHSDNLCRLLAPSIVGICLCVVCLFSMSWAWFTSNVSAQTAAITTPTYSLTYTANGSDAPETLDFKTANQVTMADTSCVISLTAQGTTGATGYCLVEVNGATYYTQNISVSNSYTFTVNANQGTAITITPKWGTRASAQGNIIENNGTIGEAVAAQNLSEDTSVDNAAEANNETQEVQPSIEPSSVDSSSTEVPSSEVPLTNSDDSTEPASNDEVAGNTEQPSQTASTDSAE